MDFDSFPPQRHGELPRSVIVLCLANLNCAFYISCHTRGTLCRRSSSQVSRRLLAWSKFSVIRKGASICIYYSPGWACASLLGKSLVGTPRSMSRTSVSKASSVISSAPLCCSGAFRDEEMDPQHRPTEQQRCWGVVGWSPAQCLKTVCFQRSAERFFLPSSRKLLAQYKAEG